MKRKFKKIRIPKELLKLLHAMSVRESVRTGYAITEETIVEMLVSVAWNDYRIEEEQKKKEV